MPEERTTKVFKIHQTVCWKAKKEMVRRWKWSEYGCYRLKKKQLKIETLGNWSWRAPGSCTDRRANGERNTTDFILWYKFQQHAYKYDTTYFSYLSLVFRFLFLILSRFSLSLSLSVSAAAAGTGLGVRTNVYFLFCSAAAFACASFTCRCGSKLLPSTKYSDMPNASLNLAFFSCCASAIWWVSRTLQSHNKYGAFIYLLCVTCIATDLNHIQAWSMQEKISKSKR